MGFLGPRVDAPTRHGDALLSCAERPDGGFELSLARAAAAPAPVHFARAPLPLARAAPFAAAIPGDGAVEAVLTSGISSFLSLYNAAIVGRLVLTWFPNPPEFIVGPLSTVTDPYLNLFRGIIPPLGGTIDLSPILAFVTLDLFTNAAAALPAEVDAEGNLVRAAPRGPRLPWAPRRGAGSAAQ